MHFIIVKSVTDARRLFFYRVLHSTLFYCHLFQFFFFFWKSIQCNRNLIMENNTEPEIHQFQTSADMKQYIYVFILIQYENIGPISRASQCPVSWSNWMGFFTMKLNLFELFNESEIQKKNSSRMRPSMRQLNSHTNVLFNKFIFFASLFRLRLSTEMSEFDSESHWIN